MKNKLYLLLYGILFSLLPLTGQAQIDLLIDLLFEFNFIFGTEGEPRWSDTEFTQYPYDLYQDGRYRPIGEEGRLMSTKASFGVQSNENDLFGLYGQIQFSPISSITLDLNHLQLFQEGSGESVDLIPFTNFTFQYNRIRNNRFNMWWDLGVTRLAERDDPSWGLSLGAGLQWFFRKPLSLMADYRYHLVDNGFTEGINMINLKLDLHLKQYIISTGYQNANGDGDLSWSAWTLGTGVYF